MPRNRSCLSFSALPWIDHAPVTPLDPIAYQAADARREGQGRRRVFQQANSSFSVSRLENVCRRRSLALDHSEQDGRMMGNRSGGLYAAIPTIMTLLCACVIAIILPAAAIADERDIGTPSSSAIAVSSTQKLPFARSSVGTPITNLWAEHIAEASHRFAIPERWIRAVIIAESDGNPHALSRVGAMGLMQIMPATWEELRNRHGLGGDPYDPRENILAGAAYLSELHDLYGSSGFLAAYNAGPGRYEKHLITGDPLPAETRAYLAKIIPMIDMNSALSPPTRRQLIDEEPAANVIFAVTTNSNSLDVNRTSAAHSAIFIARTTVTSGDKQSADDHPSYRPSNSSTITDLSALAPPSDGLFIPRPRHGVVE